MASTRRAAAEDLSYDGPDALRAAFDGLLRNPSALAWRDAELFWGEKMWR